MTDLAYLIGALRQAFAKLEKKDVLVEDRLREALWLAQYLPVRAQPDRSTSTSHRPLSDGQNQPKGLPNLPGGERSELPRQERPIRNRGLAPLFPKTAGGTGKSRVTSVYIPISGELAQPLNFAQALRPFAKKIPSRRFQVLDETATVEAYSKRRFILPVYRPQPERWFSMALVMDDAPPMTVWRSTANRLEALMARQGGFADVRFWRLTPDVRLLTKGGLQAKPRQLADPTGRTIILVLTNGVGRHWRTAPLIQVLAEWARLTPVAICSLLPESRWPHTDLGSATKWVRSAAPGLPNRMLDVGEGRHLVNREADSTPFAVFTLSPQSVARWAAMQMARAETRSPAVVLAPSWCDGELSAVPEPIEEVREDSVRRIHEFTSIASSEAVRLLHYLSAVPLTLPIMRLVQNTMLPESPVSVLAEVLMSGVVRRVANTTGKDPETWIYDFPVGARELLCGSVRLGELAKIEETVEDALRTFIERRAGISINDFPAWALSPSGSEELPDDARHFVEVSRQTLRALGYPQEFQYVEEIADRPSEPLRPSTRVTKVFLSSTGRDLKAYREAAFDAILRMDLHCIRMEDYRGPVSKVKDFDDRKVAVCDLFVMILGHLYGACPKGNEKSYTELEYEAAIKYRKTCMLFLAPEDFGFPASLIESDDKRAKQRAFRDRAVKGVIRQTFNSPDDLAAQITQAIHVLRRSSDKSNEPSSFLPLPPQPYFAHPYPLQENFTGRLRERRMLTEWLSGGRNVLSIVAIGGMGKSALTWAWLQKDVLGLPLPGVDEIDGAESRVLRTDRPEGVLWWSFYEKEASFGAFVREALYYASEGQAAPTSLYDQLKTLTALLTKRRFLLVLDGFERELRAYAGLNAAYQEDSSAEDVRSCIDPHAGDFLRWIASAPMRSRVLLTSRLPPRELDGLAGCQHEDLSAIDPEDAVRFFHAQGVKGTRAEIQAACAPYGYNPLVLRLLAGVILKDRHSPGDIRAAARHPISAEMVGKEKHHILQVAYDAMDKPKRELLSRLAAFRSPISHEALTALNPFRSETSLDAALDELIDRGLVLFDRGQARYDLHPVIRQHAYDRLTDKAGVHIRLRDYFSKVPALEKIESVDELAPMIEWYHHTVRAGLYDEALKFYQDRLGNQLYFRFGAYQICIELLRQLFPDGEDLSPRLKAEPDQLWAQNALAASYSLSGQSHRALLLSLQSNAGYEKQGDKKNVAIGLGNIAKDQIRLGQLQEADQSLRRQTELSQEIGDKFQEALGHQELGRLEAYQGRASDSLSQLETALSTFRSQGERQFEGLVWAYRTLRALLMKNTQEAVEFARRTRELASINQYERDVIQSEWLMGYALIPKSPSEAEAHLSEALTRCRRINLVEHEPDILLTWARWHRAAGNSTQSREHAEEALTIADRCDYRLVQADIHNFLAQLALDVSDRASTRHHAEIARERAWCDGPPHCYKVALEEADSLLVKTSR